MPEWKDILGAPMLLGFFMITAVVIIKLGPSWLAGRKEAMMQEMGNTREIQLADIAVREKEASARLAQGEAVAGLTQIMRATNEVTDELKIFLRASTSQSEQLAKRMDTLESEVVELKEAINRPTNGERGR